LDESVRLPNVKVHYDSNDLTWEIDQDASPAGDALAAIGDIRAHDELHVGDRVKTWDGQTGTVVSASEYNGPNATVLRAQNRVWVRLDPPRSEVISFGALGTAHGLIRLNHNPGAAKDRWKGSRVQSLLFDASLWNRSRAIAWARAHDFSHAKVHETVRYIRLRQVAPTPGAPKRVIDLGEPGGGIRAIIEAT